MQRLVSWQAIHRKADQYGITFERDAYHATLEYGDTFIDVYADSGEDVARQQAAEWLENTCEMIDTLRYVAQQEQSCKTSGAFLKTLAFSLLAACIVLFFIAQFASQTMITVLFVAAIALFVVAAIGWFVTGKQPKQKE